MTLLFALCPQQLYYQSFKIFANLVHIQWYLGVILICIFIFPHEVEHLFVYLLANLFVSSIKYLFCVFRTFFSRIVFFVGYVFSQFVTYFSFFLNKVSRA